MSFAIDRPAEKKLAPTLFMEDPLSRCKLTHNLKPGSTDKSRVYFLLDSDPNGLYIFSFSRFQTFE
jgi:hypothetical protein